MTEMVQISRKTLEDIHVILTNCYVEMIGKAKLAGIANAHATENHCRRMAQNIVAMSDDIEAVLDAKE